MIQCRVYRVFEYSQLQRLAQAGGQTVFYIFMSLIAVIVVFSGCLCLFVAQVKQRFHILVAPYQARKCCILTTCPSCCRTSGPTASLIYGPSSCCAFQCPSFLTCFVSWAAVLGLSVQIADEACQLRAMPAQVTMQTQ